MAKEIYRDPLMEKLKKILNSEGPAQLKNKYYYGDPIVVPERMLPACFINFDRQNVKTADNAHLESRINVVFNVVWDTKRDLNQQLDNIEGHMSVVRMIAGRGDDYAFLPDTIISVLRKHQDLDTNLWIDVDSDTEADWGVGIGKRGPGIYTAEGILRTQLIHQQIKPELIS